MTLGPEVLRAVALALALGSSPFLISHLPSTQPRALFPAGPQSGAERANTGVHSGLLVAINLSYWVSFQGYFQGCLLQSSSKEFYGGKCLNFHAT